MPTTTSVVVNVIVVSIVIECAIAFGVTIAAIGAAAVLGHAGVRALAALAMRNGRLRWGEVVVVVDHVIVFIDHHSVMAFVEIIGVCVAVCVAHVDIDLLVVVVVVVIVVDLVVFLVLIVIGRVIAPTQFLLFLLMLLSSLLSPNEMNRR